MKLINIDNPSEVVNLEKAVLQGIASDGGLFMPAEFKQMPTSFWDKIAKMSFTQIAFEVAKQLIGDDELDEQSLKQIVEESFNFETPLKQIDDRTIALELFHGPTLAFKDYGARFMARLVNHFAIKNNLKLTILVATSGDTGSAVGSGFLGSKNVDVVILYPGGGRISKVQEQQLTTLGHNVRAIEVDGVFDDCQRLVKKAFADEELRTKLNLSSANSINIARLIPQMFYYFWAFAQMAAKGQQDDFIVSVPSGNLGNATAALMAWKMGLPIGQLIIANNINCPFVDFLQSGKYKAQQTINTISNAMDVGNPNNFARILHIFGGDKKFMREVISAYSFDDEVTKKIIHEVFVNNGYILDPHGAVALLGLLKFMAEYSGYEHGIFLETAHPAKFSEVVSSCINKQLDIPTSLSDIMDKSPHSSKIQANFNSLKLALMS